MKKSFCRIIAIVCLISLASSTAVFAADKAAPAACDNVTTCGAEDPVQALWQRLSDLGYSDAAIKEYLAAKGLYTEQLSEEIKEEYEAAIQEKAATKKYMAAKYAMDHGFLISTDQYPNVCSAAPAVVGAEDALYTTTLTFHEDGWYVARMEVQLYDNDTHDLTWVYTDSCAKGQKASLKIDRVKYDINRVGYQIWFFGWDNDYMNLPYANTDNATDFTLSGSGDYPEFSWK